MAMQRPVNREWSNAAEAVRIAGEQLGIYRRRTDIEDAVAFAIGILAGAITGAIAGILTAPADGASMRSRVRGSLMNLRNGGTPPDAPLASTLPATITLTTIRPTAQ